MANSPPSETGFTKCLSGAVRRLLCTGSLPTHPSDQIPEMSTVEVKNPSCKDSVGGDKVEVGAGPGIVARLMGLDSLPESNWVPNSITRSMSLNFMDYFPEIDRAHGGQHRRVRTSVSFREVPGSLDQQKHDCLVLFLENVDEAGEMERDMGKSEMIGFGELKQKKTERRNKGRDSSKDMALVKKKESEENDKRECRTKIEPKRVSDKLSSKVGTCYGVEDYCSVLPEKKNKNKKKDVPATPATPKVKGPVREASVGSKFTKKNQVDPKFDSLHSSPVSAIDHNGFPVHHLTQSGGHSRKMGSKRKKASTKTANWDYPSPNLIRKSNAKDQEQRATKKREKQQSQKVYYTEMLSKICRLTEEDMKGSHWEEAKEGTEIEYFEEMCIEFEHEILNVLLQQVVNEL